MATDAKARITWDVIAKALADLLLTLPEVTIAYPYLRFENDRHSGRFSRLFEAPNSNNIDFWSVERTSQEERFLTNNEIEVRTNATLHHWYTVRDDDNVDQTSAFRFEANLDAVMQLLRNSITINGQVELGGPPQLAASDHRFFIRDLTHHAQINLLLVSRVILEPQLC